MTSKMMQNDKQTGLHGHRQSLHPLAGWWGRAALLSLLVFLAACSTTKNIPDGEQLYTGMKSTQYLDYEKNSHFYKTQEELDLVLATPPNAALFGSSTYRSPFPIGLWVWNAFAKDSTGFGNMVKKALGSTPILVSHVNPKLRAQVGENTLKKRGYFNGHISHEYIHQRNPKKAKIRYTVDMGHLWTVDTLSYVNFPKETDSIILSGIDNAEIKRGDPFDVAKLEEERQRVSDLFRDNGYFYYEKDFASYLADTTMVPGKVQLRLQMADGLDDKVQHEWSIGHITVNLKRQFMDKLTESRKMRTFTINYNGKKMPLRIRYLLNDIQLRSRQLYSQQKFEQSQRKLLSSGIFSMTTFQFVPSDTTDTCRTLNVTVDCIFDKPYDFYVEAYGKGKTSGKYGPEVIVGLTKRNAFHSGELLDFKAHGSYEWQMGHRGEGTKTGLNSYSYGLETSLTLPRLLNPFQIPMRKRLERTRAQSGEHAPVSRRRRTRFYDTPSTVLKASADVIKRAEYFKQDVVSGELRYNWRTSERSSFEFAPLSLTYEFMVSRTDSFLRLQDKHPYLKKSMEDQFIPKLHFTYAYQSPSEYLNPISWWTTVSQASNLISVAYAMFGRSWSEKGKTMFKNPYAQFLKMETNFTKIWRLTENSTVAYHVNGGIIWAYGNSEVAPYTEQFYVGGANSIRAFNVRGLGPGKYRSADRGSSYVEQTGDIKFLMNLEYRPRLFGSLYGALFLDAGNIWALRDDEARAGCKFEMSNFFRQMAVGTGFGLRYDLTYFILRLDWGIGLHVPYETGKSGFYNIDSFKDTQTFHLAIGLPF